MSKVKDTGKRQYRINIDDDIALKLDIVCAVKNKTASDYINNLLAKEFEKLDSDKLGATIEDIKNI